MPNIIEIYFAGNGRTALARPIAQWDKGQKLMFANKDFEGAEIQYEAPHLDKTLNYLIENNQCPIPDSFLEIAGEFIGWIKIVDPKSETTVYKVQFNVFARQKPGGFVPAQDEPTVRELAAAIFETAEHVDETATHIDEVAQQVDDAFRKVDNNTRNAASHSQKAELAANAAISASNTAVQAAASAEDSKLAANKAANDAEDTKVAIDRLADEVLASCAELEQDAILLAAETGLVDPAADGDGALFIEEDGVIFIL